MADLGTLLTYERMKTLINRLETVYNDAYKSAVKNEQAWINKLSSLPKDAPLEKRTAFANEVVRRGKQKNRIAREIANAGTTAARIIQGELSNIYGLNYEFSAYSISRQAELNLSPDFAIYDRNQLAVLVRENQSPFTRIAYRNMGNDTEIVKRLQNQLMQATILGESQQQIVQRIRKVTGQSISQARRVAQTERVRIQSEGRFLGMQEAAAIGLGIKKQWISRMDDRVRDDHALITGEIVDYDEPFSIGLMFPGDPDGEAAEVINCRCVMKSMVESTSPALAVHREKFGRDIGFDEWRKNRLTNAGNSGILQYRKFGTVKKLNRHIKDHLKEFPGFTKTDYVYRASELLRSQVSGDILGFTGINGKIFRYDINNNDFAVGNANGTIATLFKPTDFLEYWKEQVKKYGN